MKGARANATNLAKYEQLLNAMNTPLPRMNLAMRSFQVGQVKNHKGYAVPTETIGYTKE
jgi:hypothetical protein